MAYLSPKSTSEVYRPLLQLLHAHVFLDSPLAFFSWGIFSVTQDGRQIGCLFTWKLPRSYWNS